MRIKKLLPDVIDRFNLNLKGLTVFTEAASGAYMFTPIAAALAGAEVIAFAKDTIYAKVSDVKDDLIKWAKEFAAVKNIQIINNKTKDFISSSDIVTNSGMLRHLDREFIFSMKQNAVIALMYEAWEIRSSDIDIAACKERGIRIAAINEDHPLVDVFNYVGILAIKMLLEAGIEIYKSKIGILGSDKFSQVITKFLKNCGACCYVITPPLPLTELDAVIYTDYNGKIQLTEKDLLMMKKSCNTIVQFLGGLNFNQIKSFGLNIYPDQYVPSKKMAKTFSALGLKPTIELQTAGLKAAEIIYKGLDFDTNDPFYHLAEEIILNNL